LSSSEEEDDDNNDDKKSLLSKKSLMSQTKNFLLLTSYKDMLQEITILDLLLLTFNMEKEVISELILLMDGKSEYEILSALHEMVMATTAS